MTNCRCDVGLSVQCFRLRSSKIDVSTFEDRCVDLRRSMCRLSKIDVSTFEDRCVDLRRSMCRLSKIDVSTFGDRCVDFRGSIIGVDLRRSMCRPSKIGDQCVNLRISMVDVSTFEASSAINTLALHMGSMPPPRFKYCYV